MRRRRVRSIVLVALGLLALALASACAPPPPPPPSSPAAADMVERHNYVRGLNGIGPLAVDGGMQANAQFHADRLAAGGGCSSLWHSPELGSWYAGFAAAENVACVSGCPTSAQQAFDMWLASPGHAANAMNPGYSRIGVATACNGSVQIVVAQYRSG